MVFGKGYSSDVSSTETIILSAFEALPELCQELQRQTQILMRRSMKLEEELEEEELKHEVWRK